MYVNGASNCKGSRVGIILEGANGIVIEQSLKFAFRARNNQAEYEALIAGLKLAKELKVQRLMIRGDLQRVIGQVKGEF